MVISMRLTVPYGKEGCLFAIRENTGQGGTLYEKELDAYSCVARGDTGNVTAAFEALIKEKTACGGLETNNLDEAKYRAAEIINISARYAAQNVADEGFCIGFADECVSEIDRLTGREEIYRILIEKAAQLAHYVENERESRKYPYIIRKAVEYINANLSKNLSVCEVAEICGISPDYLSVYFKKTTGERMTAYIRRQKLILAKDILGERIRCADAAKRLSFCSESYFVKCFRDEFGITPKKWQNEAL